VLEYRCERPCVAATQIPNIPTGDLGSRNVADAMQPEHVPLQPRKTRLLPLPEVPSRMQQVDVAERCQR
jgi:hypothetical protein